MPTKTCAACDCALDDKAFTITVGGKKFDVCCEDCARQLREAHAAARSA